MINVDETYEAEDERVIKRRRIGLAKRALVNSMKLRVYCAWRLHDEVLSPPRIYILTPRIWIMPQTNPNSACSKTMNPASMATRNSNPLNDNVSVTHELSEAMVNKGGGETYIMQLTTHIAPHNSLPSSLIV